MRAQYGDYFGITVAGYPGSNFLVRFGYVDICLYVYMHVEMLIS